MPTLFEILKTKTIAKYPPLPKWVQDYLATLDVGSDEYVEFTSKVIYDVTHKMWYQSILDQ
jgi:hypothetical protein